jgi:hypothetical protein
MDMAQNLILDVPKQPTKHAVQLIGDLERGNAITGFQAKLLLEGWPLEDEWWSSPYLRTVREHSRAYIDQLRKQMANRPKEVL